MHMYLFGEKVKCAKYNHNNTVLHNYQTIWCTNYCKNWICCYFKIMIILAFICPDGKYKCEGQDKCLNADLLCDGKKDCLQGDDEIKCGMLTVLALKNSEICGCFFIPRSISCDKARNQDKVTKPHRAKSLIKFKKRWNYRTPVCYNIDWITCNIYHSFYIMIGNLHTYFRLPFTLLRVVT